MPGIVSKTVRSNRRHCWRSGDQVIARDLVIGNLPLIPTDDTDLKRKTLPRIYANERGWEMNCSRSHF